MKILLFNLNVGSGVEYCGDIIKTWIPDNFDFVEVKDQNADFAQILADNEPDIIILNDNMSHFCQHVFGYKSYHQSVKIILISHNWKEMMVDYIVPQYVKDIIQIADSIFIVNGKSKNLPLPNESIVESFYPPTLPEFTITTIWKDRPNLFCYIGNILPHKMSVEFVKKVKDSGIVIDCFGLRWDGVGDQRGLIMTGKLSSMVGSSRTIENNFKLSPWAFDDKVSMELYYEGFDEAGLNLQYMGSIPQDRVACVLNQYKYFVLPHDGFEGFNWTMLQAIFCGTIPLVVNDRNQRDFDPTWIDWARGYYYGCHTVDEMINNLKLIIADNIDRSDLSNLLASKANEDFNYDKFKNRFIEVLHSMEEK